MFVPRRRLSAARMRLPGTTAFVTRIWSYRESTASEAGRLSEIDIDYLPVHPGHYCITARETVAHVEWLQLAADWQIDDSVEWIGVAFVAAIPYPCRKLRHFRPSRALAQQRSCRVFFDFGP